MGDQLYSIKCAECGATLGYSLESIEFANTPQLLCYLCAHSICDMIQHLQLQTFPTVNDLYSIETGKQQSAQLRSAFLSQLNKIKS